jgi:hypothetical protein
MPDDLWVVGHNGTILHPTNVDGVREIALVPSGTTENLTGVWGSASDDVWIVGSSGTLLHWDGNGIKPVDPALLAGESIEAIWGSGPDDVWIVGLNVALHHRGGK